MLIGIFEVISFVVSSAVSSVFSTISLSAVCVTVWTTPSSVTSKLILLIEDIFFTSSSADASILFNPIVCPLLIPKILVFKSSPSFEIFIVADCKTLRSQVLSGFYNTI